MSTATDLKCPKCLAPMRPIERNGVVIDRCTECGGIFLDRGELERLMRAEGTYNEQTYQTDRRQRRDVDFDDDDDDYRDRDRSREGYREGSHQGHREGSHQGHREGSHQGHSEGSHQGHSEGSHQGRPYKKKRRNFLEDLLDFG